MGNCTLVSSWYYIVSTDFTTLFNVPRIVPLTLDYIAKEETLPAPYFLDKHPEWENPCFDRPILFVAHADPYLPSRASSDILNPSLLCWTLPPSLLTFESPQLFFFFNRQTPKQKRRHRGCNVPRYSLFISPISMIASSEAEAISTISFNLSSWDSLVVNALFDIYHPHRTSIRFIDSYQSSLKSICLV